MNENFWRGFRAASPMWIAAAPFALAYIIAAKEAGLSNWEMMGMSVFVYSASAQILIAQFITGGAPILTILLSVGLMHVHYLLYGLSLNKGIPLKPFERGLAAFGLTDFSFALTMAEAENQNRAFLFGIELSIFLVWNLYTRAARFFQSLLPNMENWHLDFIIPLCFFSLLVASIKNRNQLLVAIAALGAALVFPMLDVAQFSTVLVILLSPFVGMAGRK
jgi:predicted branched-subunit amino acid permease